MAANLSFNSTLHICYHMQGGCTVQCGEIPFINLPLLEKHPNDIVERVKGRLC